MSSDLLTGSASRASITAPRDVMAPFGVRERLAGFGQVLGLLPCRERGDLDGQTQMRDWLEQHPVGATGLIICLAECACEAITDARGGSNAANYVHFMTRDRLTQQYQVLLAEREGMTTQELGGYLWATPLLEQLLAADRASFQLAISELSGYPDGMWGLALGLADILRSELRLVWGSVGRWIRFQRAVSSLTAALAGADGAGAWTANAPHAQDAAEHGRHARPDPEPASPGLEPGGERAELWEGFERRLGSVAAVPLGETPLTAGDGYAALGVAVATSLLIHRDRPTSDIPAGILECLRQDCACAAGMISFLTRAAWATARETRGTHADQTVREAMRAAAAEATARLAHSDASSLWDRGRHEATQLLWHYARGDRTGQARGTATITASSEYTWGAALGLADLTLSWARSAWGENAATEWVYLVRSGAIAMDALPPPLSDHTR
jgi:hypothetical protein